MAMTQREMELQDPHEGVPFRKDVQASGHGEVWTHSHDLLKFQQFGWRSTNSENLYRKDVRVGNWNEELFDVKQRSQSKPLPSQFNHYYSTNSKDATKHAERPAVPEELRNRLYRDPHGFPGHQPELDTDQDKSRYNSWLTTSGDAYRNPREMVHPLPAPQ